MGTVCKILDRKDVKPHKGRYYLERRNPEFAEKMAEVLCAYRPAVSKRKPMAIVSYDEKPGIQAVATYQHPVVHTWTYKLDKAV